MKVTNAVFLALLVGVALFLGGCGAGEEAGPVAYLVTVTGLLADAGTHAAVANATVTVGGQPAVSSGVDGWFTVPNVQPGVNLPFQGTHPDYEPLQGFVTLDSAARTWSLVVAGAPEKQGNLVEESAGYLSFPGAGEVGALVVDLTGTGDGDGGDDLPPPPPF